MLDHANFRIVEIGDKPYVKSAFPAHVEFFSTRPDDIAHYRDPCTHAVSLKTIPLLARRLRDPAVSLIVCHPTSYAPWQWSALGRMLFNRRLLTRPFPLIPTLGPQLLRRPAMAPIVVVDHADLPLINRQNRFLLDRCAVYFKRELPCDRWQLFMKTLHPDLPTPRYRLIERHRTHIEKLRPLSLGLPRSWSPDTAVRGPSTKSADVFFAGRSTGSSFVRQRGMGELVSLRERGFTIDIPETPLPHDEFRRRCASAWLCWSPEGLGWDCFRHYESAVFGSVPVINQPAIERHQPLLHGKHAIYYDIEPGGLTRAVTAALSDKTRLAAMAIAGCEHVMRHHTPTALATYIVSTGLQIAAAETRGAADQ